ncbi:MAG: multidrug efflux system membrane fusion protein [Candidatus Azotimanducaceae bacterium]|jgi:multidrug efflux system membrane fusion protein
MRIAKSVSLSIFCIFTSLNAAVAQETSARPAKVEQVQTSETVFTRKYPAIVKPSQEAVLSFRVSGRVIELPILASMPVSKGDVIAQLDPRDFETKIAQLISQLDQANAQLRALRSGARAEEISALEAGIDAVQAQVDQAREQASRTRELFQKELVAAVKLDQDETTLRVAEAELRAKLEELSIGRAGGRKEEVEAAEAAIRGLDTQIQTAKDNKADATLRAPFDGAIARRDIENFTNVQAGQDIALLQNVSTVIMEFDVPGADVIRFSGSDDVTSKVAIDALPGLLFDAKLVEFSTVADASTQTYRGRVSVVLPEGSSVLPGMVGSITGTTNEDTAAAITVPLTAVGANADGSAYVWVVGDQNAVSKQAVVLGDASGARVAITEGLSGDETVVTAGVSQLQDGMTIRPITKVGG